MNYFVLERKKDVSGISGTGIVAEGIIFSDGSVAYRWFSDTPTTTLAANIDIVRKLHGHDGNTKVKYMSFYPDYFTLERDKKKKKE
jgi:hypothetical protein